MKNKKKKFWTAIGALILTGLAVIAKESLSPPSTKKPEPEEDWNKFPKGQGVVGINRMCNEYFSAEGMERQLNKDKKND